MRIMKRLGYGIIGTLSLVTTSSCKRGQLFPATDISVNVTKKVDSLSKITQQDINDRPYVFYGQDTLEITKEFYTEPSLYMEYLNKQALKNTPKTQVGKHLEIQMIPKRGGGFDQIPVWKKDYKPDYKDQKTVIKSSELFTTDGKDLYIPVEYYGIKNN